MKAAEHARALALRWGWPAWVGLPLLLGAWLLQAAWVPGLRAAADAAVAEAAQARRTALLSARQRLAVPEEAPAQRPTTGVDALPQPGERAQRLAALLAQATAQGLSWRRGEFRVEPLREAGVEAYGLNLPVSGPYPALRAFIASALDADAALALDGMRLQRPSAAAPTVEAELQFTLYSRAAGPVRPR